MEERSRETPIEVGLRAILNAIAGPADVPREPYRGGCVARVPSGCHENKSGHPGSLSGSLTNSAYRGDVPQ
jgi:hypothetical protein